MTKIARTTDIIKLLTAYETVHGTGDVAGISTVCSDEIPAKYLFHVKSMYGEETTIEVPAVKIVKDGRVTYGGYRIKDGK